jgi:hypothetical protein
MPLQAARNTCRRHSSKVRRGGGRYACQQKAGKCASCECANFECAGCECAGCGCADCGCADCECVDHECVGCECAGYGAPPTPRPPVAGARVTRGVPRRVAVRSRSSLWEVSTHLQVRPGLLGPRAAHELLVKAGVVLCELRAVSSTAPLVSSYDQLIFRRRKPPAPASKWDLTRSPALRGAAASRVGARQDPPPPPPPAHRPHRCVPIPGLGPARSAERRFASGGRSAQRRQRRSGPGPPAARCHMPDGRRVSA